MIAAANLLWEESHRVLPATTQKRQARACETQDPIAEFDSNDAFELALEKNQDDVRGFPIREEDIARMPTLSGGADTMRNAK